MYGFLDKYEFSIYNRWEQMVFHSSKQGQGWDGTISGALQSTGAFVWRCSYQFSGDKAKTDKGTLILIRRVDVKIGKWLNYTVGSFQFAFLALEQKS